MKILVTGANGYIGQGVVKELLDSGSDVIAADLCLDNIDSRATKLNINIFSPNVSYVNLGSPEAVLHLAWRNGFVHNAASHIEDLPLHYSFIKKMIDGGVKQLAVMGTMHEIGFFEGSINENTPTNPQSLYGISKDALRKMTVLMCSQEKIIYQWIRAYYIVGNSEFGSSIFSKITKAEKEGEEEFPFTMGQNQWDFIDYGEFCKQIVAIVSQNKVNGIINACSGYPEKLGTRVQQFIVDNGYNIKLKYGAFPERPYDSKAVWGDNGKILQILKAF
ncbi:NAD-dependent epimerase/dehydratase family protein [Sphaerochaeta globosa]|uniref:NAD-dependent epimerase/dehydratase n=1 Tax=Sphaerochaeta globosa (strain ATCC BAA-1886 / DSM 22777 / Buddy) TaxID=158189 RepID=F0RXT7_SPHGB|nr:NAD(P)-dependent oxidoreductase [Sphaerochaeta globosa]ADY12214.1 NAD-dependent epimerase/dehydratase [Sphaerochaeta globosa str. Buddy]